MKITAGDSMLRMRVHGHGVNALCLERYVRGNQLSTNEALSFGALTSALQNHIDAPLRRLLAMRRARSTH